MDFYDQGQKYILFEVWESALYTVNTDKTEYHKDKGGWVKGYVVVQCFCLQRRWLKNENQLIILRRESVSQNMTAPMKSCLII